MKKILKLAGALLGALVALLLVGFGAVYGVSENTRSSTIDAQPDLSGIETSQDSEIIARGNHIYESRGCPDCHGEKLEGKVVVDDPAVGTLAGPNLTSGEGGVASTYEDAKDWARSIRHGIAPSGRPLIFMPSHEYFRMDDADISALISFIQAAPPVDNEAPEIVIGPMARVLWLAGEFPLFPAELIDHSAHPGDSPPEGPTAEYGEYMAAGCVGCHGEGLSGGPIPGVPPDWPEAANLTPHESGLKDWSREEFETLLTTGVRPDGRKLNSTYMPWKVTRAMNDMEREALWKYFRSIDPKPAGNR